MAPTIPVPVLMPKQTQVTHSPMARVLRYPEMTVSNVENSLMHNTSFACRQAAYCAKSSSNTTCRCSQSQNCVRKGRSCAKGSAHRKLIAKKYFENFGWDSPNFLAIWRQILDSSCSTAAIMELHSPWVICVLHFLSHGHNAALVGTAEFG
jgi:hypothetical protein